MTGEDEGTISRRKMLKDATKIVGGGAVGFVARGLTKKEIPGPSKGDVHIDMIDERSGYEALTDISHQLLRKNPSIKKQFESLIRGNNYLYNYICDLGLEDPAISANALDVIASKLREAALELQDSIPPKNPSNKESLAQAFRGFSKKSNI